MRILVMESETGIATPYEQELVEAGHEVVRCHEPGAPAFPCAGVTDHEACPLEHGAVDVALLVRDPIAERPTARESGVACALRARVPVLEPGLDEGADPFTGYVERFEGDVVTAVEAIADRPSAGHADAVKAHLLTSPAAASIDPDALVVTAWRRGTALNLEVALPPDAPQELHTAAAAWAIGAARRYDPGLQTIDVALR
jgi:hypothetical protein